MSDNPESLEQTKPWLPYALGALKFGVLAGCIGFLLWLVLPRTYQSEAHILPADSRGSSSLGQLAGAAAAVGIAIPGQESADAAYVDILNSRWLRTSLLEAAYNYTQRGWFWGGGKKAKGTLLDYYGAKNRDAGIRKLRRHMSVSRDIRTKLITITVDSESPELSQAVTQEAVRLLEIFVLERTQSRGGNKAKFVEQRLVDARSSMVKAERDLREFLNVNRNFQSSPDPSIRLAGLRLESEMRLRQQLVTTLALSHEQALMEEKNDMPILNVLDEANLPIESSSPGRITFAVGGFLLGLLGFLAYSGKVLIRKFLSGVEG